MKGRSSGQAVEDPMSVRLAEVAVQVEQARCLLHFVRGECHQTPFKPVVLDVSTEV